MKKVLSTLLFFGLILMGSAFNTATAQNMEGDLSVGAGLVYGTGVFGFDDVDNDLGLQVNGYYSITPEIRVGGDFTYYFPATFEDSGPGFSEEETWTVTELNINGHYFFINEADLRVYALAGINITRASISFEIQDDFFGNESGSESSSETGLNLGAGLEYALDFADFYGEAKLANVGGDADQFVLGVGLRFKF